MKFYIFLQFSDTMAIQIYLKAHNAHNLEATMGSIKAWKAVELEKITIRRLFLDSTLACRSLSSIRACQAFACGQFQYWGSNFSLVCRHDSLPTPILLAMLFLLSMSWSFLHITPPYVHTVCCFDEQLWVSDYGLKFKVKEMPTCFSRHVGTSNTE
jgi:hypothetical protein